MWISFHEASRPQKSFEFVSPEERDTLCSLCTVLAPEVPVTDDGETKAGPHVVIHVVWTLTSGARRRERALRVDVERRTLTIQKRDAAPPPAGSQSEVRPAFVGEASGQGRLTPLTPRRFRSTCFSA